MVNGFRRGLALALALAAVASAAAARGQDERRPPRRQEFAVLLDTEEARRAAKLVKLFEIPGERRRALAALVKLGEASTGPLMLALDDPRPSIVQYALLALESLGPGAKAATPRVAERVKSEDREIAFCARRALSAIEPRGITMVAEYTGHRLIELDAEGEVVREIPNLRNVWDAERLPNGNFLVTLFTLGGGFPGGEVREIDEDGKTVWSNTDVRQPFSAQRLPNGNTLISGYGSVVEVRENGDVAWKYDQRGVRLADAERLIDGNTLIADYRGKRVIEVDPDGAFVWELEGVGMVMDADRLPSGNTLICIRDQGIVREVDPEGRTVLEIEVQNPTDADRLPDGSTLVAAGGKVLVFGPDGNETWTVPVKSAGAASRY